MTSNTNKLSHAGSVRGRAGGLRIVLEDRILAIPASGTAPLLAGTQPAEVYDMRDVLASPDPRATGTAWISRSGRALMIETDAGQYVSPLAQVVQVAAGTRAGANLSVFRGRC